VSVTAVGLVVGVLVVVIAARFAALDADNTREER
jgi:hypothetical protein